MTVKERELPGPGWTRNPMGFIVKLERGSLMPFCQKTVTRRGEREACGRNPEYARTMWDAGVVFACGRHLADMENYARPLRSVNSNGGPVVIINGERMARPHYLDVPGATEPGEHPAHVETETEPGRRACWCGAVPTRDERGRVVWEGGRPLDPSPWPELTGQRERRING